MSSREPQTRTRALSLRILAATVATGALVAVLCGCGGSSRTSYSAAASKSAATLDAPAVLQPPAPTPDFALRDSLGRRVRLSEFRGKAVLLTFIYDHCPDVCPLIVGNLHTALVKLGSQASKVQIVAIPKAGKYTDVHGRAAKMYPSALARNRLEAPSSNISGRLIFRPASLKERQF